MTTIGDQDGIAAAINRLRDLDPKGTALKKGADGWPPLSALPADITKWKAYDKLQRTLQILADDHDGGSPPPLPPSQFPMIPSPTKGKNGLYYYNYPGQLGEARIIQLAKQHNLWVALLVNETDRTPLSDGQPLPESVIFATRDRLKNAGLMVVATGWAEPGSNLQSQASFIGHMAQGFDEYMLNIEAAWAYPQPGFPTSDSFAPLVRQALGQKPLSLCPDWGNQIHWKPWLEAAMFAVRVQCYLNEWPHKNPKDGLEKLSQAQHDLPNGIPPDVSREAVYGKYGNNLQPLSTWTPQDDAAGKPPRSVWAAEFCDEADVNWIAR